MTKIPVLRTIGFAYAFAFGEIGTIIGLIWLPTVVIAVLQFLPYALGTGSQDGDVTAGAEFLNLVFSFATFLLYAMNAVAVTRQALGLRQGGATLHFALGLAEWRMLGAILLATFIVGGLLIGWLLGLSAFATMAGAGATLAAAVYAIAGIAALTYVAVRLVPLLVPVVVAEERVDLTRGWLLLRGNTWRIFLVMAAVSLPPVIVQILATIWIGGPGLVAPLPTGSNAMTAAINARMITLDRHMPELIGLFLLLAPFSLGLTLGAEAAAYRALVPQASRRQA